MSSQISWHFQRFTVYFQACHRLYRGRKFIKAWSSPYDVIRHSACDGSALIYWITRVPVYVASRSLVVTVFLPNLYIISVHSDASGSNWSPPTSASKVIYFSTSALFRVLTNVALPDGAGGASHRITFTNEPQQGTYEDHEYHFKPHGG